MAETFLPLGKLPVELLQRLIADAPVSDPRVLLGPGIGLDCAVIEMGERYQVIKSDPITFATDEIGWYAVQINANDIATTGAEPRWFWRPCCCRRNDHPGDGAADQRASCLQPAASTASRLSAGIPRSPSASSGPSWPAPCSARWSASRLVTPRGAAPSDAVLLTKGLAIEATAILAREFPDRLRAVLGEGGDACEAAAYLHKPGISVLPDARGAAARRAGEPPCTTPPRAGWRRRCGSWRKPAGTAWRWTHRQRQSQRFLKRSATPLGLTRSIPSHPARCC